MSKHIDIRYHFIRELINNGEIYLEFCKSEDQSPDIFTKPLAKERFEHLRKGLGIIEKSSLRGSVENSNLDGAAQTAQPTTNHLQHHPAVHQPPNSLIINGTQSPTEI